MLPHRLIGVMLLVPWHPMVGWQWQTAKVIMAEWSSLSPQRVFANHRVTAIVQESMVFGELV